MPFEEVKELIGDVPRIEILNISPSKQRVKATLMRFSFIDKDTGHYVFYIPSLELSGYGNNREEAHEMIQFSIDEYFSHLVSLSRAALSRELANLGWNHSRIKNKEYSKAFVDQNGVLQNFNAENVEVEELSIP